MYKRISDLTVLTPEEVTGTEQVFVTDVLGISKRISITDLTTNIGGVIDAYSKAETQTSLPKIGFNTTNTVVPGVGQFAWNIDDGTIDLGLNNATLQLGQEILVPVRNNSGITIQDGCAVMITGSLGNSGKVTVAKANMNKTNTRYILGVVTQDITNNSDGFCTVYGKVRNINTTGSEQGESWVDGDMLYVKPNTAGILTKVQPADYELKMPIAQVIKAHSSGTLFVRASNTDENHSKMNISTSEFVTNATRGNKTVYGIEVDIGALPNNAEKLVSFAFNSSFTYWIDSQNSYFANNTGSYPLNFSDIVGNTVSCFLNKSNNKISINTTDDKSSFNGRIVILYTK